MPRTLPQVSSARMPMPPHPAWRWARGAMLVGAGLLLVALVVRPEPTAQLFWAAIVPLLPASFLVHPGIWRAVCPLATVGMGAVGPGTSTRARPWWITSGAVGIVLLLLAIPARHILLNQHPLALAAFLTAVFAAAWALGRRHPLRAGFCNSYCPVLPVERLYGQAPLLGVGNPRCPTCTACSPVECVDLTPERSMNRVIGPARKERRWILTPFGAFAAAFPGVILAYFLTPYGYLSQAGTVYAVSFGAGALSWGAVALIVLATGLSARYAVPVLGVLAIGAYYWFAIPGGLALVGAEGRVAVARGVAELLIGGWGVVMVRSRL